jgi:hypothetical protein
MKDIVTGQNKVNLVDLLESTRSEAAKPRLDLKRAGQLFEEFWPEGFDSFLDSLPLSAQRLCSARDPPPSASPLR